MIRRPVLLLAVLAALLLVGPAAALAAAVPGPGTPAPVPAGPAALAVPLYLAALSALVPLVGYVLNHFAPWATEPTKGIVQAVLAAGTAVLYQAVTPGDLGLNDQTLLACLTAMVSALLAHTGWRAAGINVLLGAGSNAPKRDPQTGRFTA